MRPKRTRLFLRRVLNRFFIEFRSHQQPLTELFRIIRPGLPEMVRSFGERFSTGRFLLKGHVSECV